MSDISMTLDEAKAALAREPEGTPLFAACNALISAHAANEINIGLVGVKVMLGGTLVACEPMWKFVASNKLTDAELEALRAGDRVTLESGHCAEICS